MIIGLRKINKNLQGVLYVLTSSIRPMMNTKLSLSKTKIIGFTIRLNDTRTRYGRSTISATLSSKPAYSGELKVVKETSGTEPLKKKNASNEDNFLSKIAINYLSKTLRDTAGSYLTSILCSFHS